MTEDGEVAREIRDKLREAFRPDALDVVDESDQHVGHAGYQPGGQSHFRVRLKAEVFGPMSRLARHRAVHAALGADLIGRIHALAIEIEV
ncbi:MAG: BolA family transcriptional regulator [Pseudomonadota bacterium]